MADPLHFLTVGEAAELIAARKLSPVELIETSLARIAALDGQLDSFVTVTSERARRAAKAAEAGAPREWAAGRGRDPPGAARRRYTGPAVSSTHVIRPLRAEDADALGAVHVRAWQKAYRGLMPDDYLAGLTVAERAARWAEALTQPPRPRAARLGAERDGRVVGFILVGSADGDAASEIGEVYALNVDPDHWGSGIGKALLRAGMAQLRDAGFGVAILWVLPGNSRARRFYELASWRHDDARRRQEVLGVDVEETRYRCALGGLPG